MQKIIIFGATGTVGRHLVSQALEAGYQVSAFTRNRQQFTESHPALQVVEGDVLQLDQVKQAIAGHDIVFCTLGAGRKGEVRSKGTENIVRAMEDSDIKRFICQSTLGAGDSHETLNFFWKRIMFGWFLKKAFEDHEIQEKHVFSSQLDWTLVRPAAFTNGPKTGKYRHGSNAQVSGSKLKISRADVANFMLQQASSKQYLRRAAGLTY